jgi:RimJ/RimL family protein N-acetyltransferase
MPLEGKTIILREERPEDMSLLTELRNDLETQAWGITLPPDFTEAMHTKRFEGREFSYNRDDGRFIIENKERGEVMGSIVYSGVEPRWDVSIGIMVDKRFWGTGVAYEAQEILLKFLFEELGMRVVRLWTQSGNPRAVGLAKKSGFKIAFRRRQAVFKDGKLYDTLPMDLLREEYYTMHPELADGMPPL